MFVSCDCCVLSGRGLCDGLITSPEESYRLWCVFVCGNLMNEEAMARVWSQSHRKKIYLQRKKTVGRTVIDGTRLIKVKLKVDGSVWARKKRLKQTQMQSFSEGSNETFWFHKFE